MKRLMVLSAFFISTTISNVAMSCDDQVAIGLGGGQTSYMSWVVVKDEIYFCLATRWEQGIAQCIKARKEKSK